MTERKKTDWEAIEADYRAGVLTHREMAARHGVSHAAIQKRARRDNWARDLSAKIKKEADIKVAKAQVAKEVAKTTLATENEIIEANAQAITKVVLEERGSMSRARAIVQKLFERFEEVSESSVNAVGVDVKIFKDLMDAIRTLTEIERRVFNIDDKQEIKDALKSMLDRIAQGNFSTLPVVEEA